MSRPAAASAGRGLLDALALAVVTVTVLDRFAVTVRTVVSGPPVVVLEETTVVDVSMGGVVDVSTTMLVTLPRVEDTVVVSAPLSVAETEMVGMTVWLKVRDCVAFADATWMRKSGGAPTRVEVSSGKPLPVMLEGPAMVESVDTTLVRMELSEAMNVVVVVVVVLPATSVALGSTGKEMLVEDEAMLMKKKPRRA